MALIYAQLEQKDTAFEWLTKGVDQIVDVHGGGIDVSSEPGRGTQLTIRLPLTSQS